MSTEKSDRRRFPLETLEDFEERVRLEDFEERLRQDFYHYNTVKEHQNGRTDVDE